MTTSTANKVRPAKGKTAAEALVTGAAVIIALVLLNVLTCGARAKVDLTEGNVYSLSPSSRSLVRNMPEKVNIRAYFGNVPAEQAEKQHYVDMLLAEYADGSGGKITYLKQDPWEKKELQEELRKEGVMPLQLQVLRDDRYQQVPMYFHVVFSHLDQKELWAPQGNFALEGLEYEFTTRIKRLGYGKKKVGVTTGFGEPPQSQVLADGRVGLGDLYEVTPVNWKDDPRAVADPDVLVVNGPTDKVSDAAKYQLDQRIMSGKPVLFLVRGLKWQSGGGQPQMPGMPTDPNQPYLGMPADHGLDDLLAAYGFEVAKDTLLDPRNSAPVIVPPGSRGGILAYGFAPLAEVLQGGEKQLLQGIEFVVLPFASSMKLVGPLADAKGADTKVYPLFRTAPSSFARKDVLALTRELKLTPKKEEAGQHLAGAAASAKFASAFAAGAPAGVDAAGSKQLKESAAHTRVVVVSAPAMVDQAFLVDRIYLNGLAAIHNLVDWLAEDTDLVAVRGKQIERPIDKLEDGTRTVVKYANVAGAPLLLVLAGVAYWRVRENRRRNIKL